jgi:hypothetical protein
MRSRVLLSILTLLALLVVRPAAQQQFVLSSQDRARLIAVDFAVVGADGLPVRDLRADEVTLKIDGRARTVRSLEYVSLVDAAGPPSLHPSVPPYGSNTATEPGRSVVLIIDRETIRPGGDVAMKAQINTFLRGLGPRDRVALMTLPYGGLKVDFTTEHHRISQGLASISGQAPIGETDSEGNCRSRDTLVALRGTLEDLKGGEAPVAVVLFTGQMSTPMGIVLLRSAFDVGRCAIRPEYFKQVSAAAATARAQVFIVQPDLSVADGSRAGLEHLSGVTGAPLLPLAGNGPSDSALAMVARETSGYYLARIEPESSETAGMVRGLDVSVSRRNVTVRQRPQMSVNRTATRFEAPETLTPLDMMKQSRVFRDLPLRVTAYSSREPGTDRVRVLTMFDSPDAGASLTRAMVGLFDDTGRMVASTQLSGADLAASPVVTALAVPPGTYRLRVAAVETNGRAGAADYSVTAELAGAGPLTLSALVMGLSRGGRFSPRLEFGTEASAMAYLEIYGGKEGTAVGVAFEIARTPNGPAIVTLPGAFAATNEPDRFTITAALPIGALAPGDYVVRATVAAQGQAGGRVLRPLRKVSR